jgi:hypothetical protein
MVSRMMVEPGLHFETLPDCIAGATRSRLRILLARLILFEKNTVIIITIPCANTTRFALGFPFCQFIAILIVIVCSAFLPYPLQQLLHLHALQLSNNVARVFGLKYSPSLHTFLEIAKAVGVNFFFEDKDGKSDLNLLFERAMEQLGRRADRLPKN